MSQTVSGASSRPASTSPPPATPSPSTRSPPAPDSAAPPPTATPSYAPSLTNTDSASARHTLSPRSPPKSNNYAPPSRPSPRKSNTTRNNYVPASAAAQAKTTDPTGNIKTDYPDNLWITTPPSKPSKHRNDIKPSPAMAHADRPHRVLSRPLLPGQRPQPRHTPITAIHNTLTGNP
jgi:hypothetical protein